MNVVEEAYEKAIRVLDHCVKSSGFWASGLPGGYQATWARDSMIMSLGAALVGTRFRVPFKKSIVLLTRHQSLHGQIPNAVGSYNIERRSRITYNSIDSTLWYLVGHHVYRHAYHDTFLRRRHRKNIVHALRWLSCQDPNEDMLLVQQPTMDWQDAFPHKYGRTISTNTLYYAVLLFTQKQKLAAHIRNVINGDTERYLSLWDPTRGYYLPWVWKNHDGDREEGHWFDTFGNLLTIITGLATPKIAKSILRYIERKKIARPYACQALYPPLTPRDKEWYSYFSKSEARVPYHYLNGGIWPFIGGFYVACLVKTKQFARAEKELMRLAKANREAKKGSWGFHEWLDGQKGKPIGGSNPYQGWSAGAYIFAYESVKRKRVPFFI